VLWAPDEESNQGVHTYYDGVVMNGIGWTRRGGVHAHTGYRWFENGSLPAPARRAGPMELMRRDEDGDQQ
jgi:hypothetical protein